MKKVLVRLFVVFCLVASSLLVAPFSVVHADIPIEDFDNTYIYNVPLVQYEYYNNEYYSIITIFFRGQFRGQAKFSLRFQLGPSGGGTYRNWEQVKAFNGSSVICVIRNAQPVFPDTLTATVSNPVDVCRITDSSMDYPFESYGVQTLNLEYNELYGIERMYNYTFNVFRLHVENSNYNTVVEYSVEPNNDYYFIFACDKDFDTDSDYVRYFTTYPSMSPSIAYISNLEQMDNIVIGGSPFKLYKVKYHSMNSGILQIKYTRATEDTLFMPIYFHEINTNVSTDFALRFGLDNRLLLAIEAIEPTIQTDESADDLDIKTNDFSDTADNLFNYEDDFNNDMNTALNNINVNFDVGNTFGSKFLASAQWVRQQFDNLTSTSPFGTVLSFSLILGLALLIIGKAVK